MDHDFVTSNHINLLHQHGLDPDVFHFGIGPQQQTHSYFSSLHAPDAFLLSPLPPSSPTTPSFNPLGGDILTEHGHPVAVVAPYSASNDDFVILDLSQKQDAQPDNEILDLSQKVVKGREKHGKTSSSDLSTSLDGEVGAVGTSRSGAKVNSRKRAQQSNPIQKQTSEKQRQAVCKALRVLNSLSLPEQIRETTCTHSALTSRLNIPLDLTIPRIPPIPKDQLKSGGLVSKEGDSSIGPFLAVLQPPGRKSMDFSRMPPNFVHFHLEQQRKMDFLKVLYNSTAQMKSYWLSLVDALTANPQMYPQNGRLLMGLFKMLKEKSITSEEVMNNAVSDALDRFMTFPTLDHVIGHIHSKLREKRAVPKRTRCRKKRVAPVVPAKTVQAPDVQSYQLPHHIPQWRPIVCQKLPTAPIPR